jgi:hypothetical protein
VAGSWKLGAAYRTASQASAKAGSSELEPGRVREAGFLPRRSVRVFGAAPRWTLLALILLGFGLRVLRLDFQPLWWDEGYSVWFATHPLGSMAALTAQDIHPPLYYALLHGWALLLGAGPVALRLLSVIAGSLTIPVLYLAARRMFTRRAALMAALLAAISPLAVFYSQEVRMYGLVALLSSGILLVAWRILGQRDSRALRRNLLFYVLLTTAALYTQYYAVFLPIGLTLFAFWQWWWSKKGRMTPARARADSPAPDVTRMRSDPALGSWLGAQLVVVLLYLPWIIYAGPELVPYVSQKVVQDADRPLGLLVYIARHLSAFLAGHLEGSLAPFWPVALLLLIPLALGLIWAAKSDTKRSANRQMGASASGTVSVNQPSAISDQPPANPQSAIVMLLFVLITALLLGWLVGLRYPFFPERGERLLLCALPTILLAAAAGLDALLASAPIVGYAALGLSVAVSTVSLAAFYATPRYADNDYRPLIAHIVEQGLPGDTVFAVYPWQAGYWRAYGDPNGPVDMLLPSLSWGAPLLEVLDGALEQGRVWFPAHLSLGGLLEMRIEDYLRAHSVVFLNEWHGPNTRLSGWARVPAASAVDLAPVSFLLPGGDSGTVELTGASAQLDTLPAANAVMPLSLSWQAESMPPVLNVSVRLTDDLGQTWAQHDYEPLGGSALSGGEEPSCDTCGDKSVLPGGQAHPWKAQDRLGLLIPAGTPPGRYQVEVVLHPESEVSPLNAVSAEGRLVGESARLFDITISPADRAVGPEHLPIAMEHPVDLAGGLRLLGYSLDDTPATPGDERKISLFWQAAERPAAEYTAFVQLLDRRGQVAAGWEAPPGAGYPTQVWAPGTLMRTQASIRVPAHLSDGSYRLIGGLFRADDKERLRTTRGDDHFALGRLTVRGRSHETNPPVPEHTADDGFDNLARLVGYDLAPPAEGVTPGDSLPLTLYWQALGASERPYTVFVHLLDESGGILGYGDGEPAAGLLPTTGWLAGEYLKDPHAVAIRSDAPAGAYRLAIGLYNPATGERLKTPDGADQVMLDVPVLVR